MKKLLLTFASLALFTISVLAQETPKNDVLPQDKPKNLEDSLRIGWWDTKTQFGVNVSQAAFNSSWSGGGVNNFALGFLFGHRADYHKGKGIWANDLQLQYGIISNKGEDTKKSIDRIFFDSKYAHKISDKWNWFAGVNLLSQFAPGYDVTYSKTKPISNLFSPLYIAEGIGIEYRPNKYFSAQFGGATIRQTIVSTEVINNFTEKSKSDKAYGISKGSNLLNELGFQVVANYNRDVAQNINLKWRYQAFLAYSPVTNLSHRLDLTATAKFNKYLNVNFTFIGLYDKNVIDALQLSEGFAIGFLYTM